MVFRVPLDGFAEAVERLLGPKVAAIGTREGRTVVSSADPVRGLVVAAFTSKPAIEVTAMVKEWGFETLAGEWIGDGLAMCPDDEDASQAYVVGIAYKSRESMPGLWMDAFPFAPTQSEALKRMYDEFVRNGEIEDIGFEEFLRLTTPNVVTLSPDEIARFLRSHEDHS